MMSQARAEHLREKLIWRLTHKYHKVRRGREVRGPTLQAKIRGNLRARFCSAVRKKHKGGSAVRDLGCTIEKFTAHIAYLFKPGMSWDNWGEWHLDHIKPLATFDLTVREEVQEACHYTNIRPLWARENFTRPKPKRDRLRTARLAITRAGTP